MRFTILALATLIAAQAHAKSVVPDQPQTQLPDSSVRASVPFDREQLEVSVDGSGAGMVAADAPPGTAGDVVIPKPAAIPAPALPPPVPVTIDQVQFSKRNACAKLKSSYRNARAAAELKLNAATKDGSESKQNYYRCRYDATYEAMSNAEQLVCTGSMSASEAQLKLIDSLHACNAKTDSSKPVVAASPKQEPIILTTPEYRAPASEAKQVNRLINGAISGSIR